MLTCAPLFSIAVYKALYKSFGGFAADVVAAVDQVCMIGLVVFHYKNRKIKLTVVTKLRMQHYLFCYIVIYDVRSL